MDEFVDAIKKRLEGKTLTLAQAKKDIAKLLEYIHDLDDDVYSLQENIDDLEGHISDLENEISGMKDSF